MLKERYGGMIPAISVCDNTEGVALPAIRKRHRSLTQLAEIFTDDQLRHYRFFLDGLFGSCFVLAVRGGGDASLAFASVTFESESTFKLYSLAR